MNAGAAYALRLDRGETARYALMAEWARQQEGDLWELAGLRPGARVADVGCGPGAVLALLAEIVGPDGRAVGVDADPDAVERARAHLAVTGAHTAEVRVGRADDTGLEPGSFDAVVVRHVLAHNGGAEQRIVDHLAQLVRPGGHVLLVDVDAAAGLTWPDHPDLDDLHQRYQRWHAARGNDVRVGRRLPELLGAAGTTVAAFRGWFQTGQPPPGLRGPGWAARDALVAAGLATPQDVDRWAAAFAEVDGRDERPTAMRAFFAAVGRRPQDDPHADDPHRDDPHRDDPHTEEDPR